MKKFDLPDFVKSLDIFSGSIPTFRLNGRASVQTSAGAICSIIIFALTCAFGLLKL